MALSSQGCEASCDTSPLFLGPGQGEPIHLPQLAAACGKGPRWVGGGQHLLLSLFLSPSSPSWRRWWGEGTGGTPGIIADSEHHGRC